MTAQIGGPSLSGGFSITSLIPTIDFSALNALLKFDPSAALADNSEPEIVVTAQKKCNIFC